MIRDTEVDAQLRRILCSSAFVTSERSKQFLEFCVDRALRGDVSQLKETTIAVEVFLRPADYDPKIDPIVRVHARRVRDKLEVYYRTSGVDDPIKIDLPKGGYVPKILRTLPRRKIDFSDWEEQDQSGNAPAAALSPAVPISHSFVDTVPLLQRPNWIVMVAIMLGIAVASFTVAWVWRGKPPERASQLGPLKPMTSIPDTVSDYAWSPDATRLAYTVLQKENKSHIYIKNVLDRSSPVRVTDDDASESRPVWSPDGKELAFARKIDLSHFEIVRLDLRNNKSQSIGRFQTYWPIAEDHPALDWSPDGQYLLTAEQTAAANPMHIVRISLATAERIALTSPPVSSSGDIEAKFSPDSQTVAFRRGGLGDLYIVSVQGEQAQPAVRLTFDIKGVRGIAWIDHGQSILFGTRRDQTAAFDLWKISKTGGNLEPVSPSNFDAVDPSVSSTGLLALQHREVVTDLVERSLVDDRERVLLPSDNVDATPIYSPDEKYVAFTSTRTGSLELWLYRQGEAAPMQLTHYQGRGIVILPSWAPDSKSIVFSLREHGATNIFLYDIASKTLRALTSSRNRDISPVYGYDGRYIYYSSNDDGTSRIWRLRADGSSRAEPLFVEAVVGFMPSPDGKWLYFMRDGDELSLFRRSLQDGTTEEVFHVSGHPTFLNGFAIANNRIFLPVSQNDPSTSDVFEMDFNGKNAHVASHLKQLSAYSESGKPGFSVSADGSRLIAEHMEHYQSTLYTANFLH